MVVTICMFAINPTVALVYFGWVMFSGNIVVTCYSTVCIVLVTAVAVVIILGLPLITDIAAMVLLYIRSLVGGVL